MLSFAGLMQAEFFSPQGLSHYFDWRNGVTTHPRPNDKWQCNSSILCDDKIITNVARCITGQHGWVEYDVQPMRIEDGQIATEVVIGCVEVETFNGDLNNENTTN